MVFTNPDPSYQLYSYLLFYISPLSFYLLLPLFIPLLTFSQDSYLYWALLLRTAAHCNTWVSNQGLSVCIGGKECVSLPAGALMCKLLVLPEGTLVGEVGSELICRLWFEVWSDKVLQHKNWGWHCVVSTPRGVSAIVFDLTYPRAHTVINTVNKPAKLLLFPQEVSSEHAAVSYCLDFALLFGSCQIYKAYST